MNANLIAEKVLQRAIKIVTGNRQEEYGSAEDSFSNIADLLNASGVQMSNGKNGRALHADDTAMMMIMLKMGREQNKPKLDNMVDVCGYAALGAGVKLSNKLNDFISAHQLGMGEEELRRIAGSSDVYDIFAEIVADAQPPVIGENEG